MLFDNFLGFSKKTACFRFYGGCCEGFEVHHAPSKTAMVPFEQASEHVAYSESVM
jgi:hypothetical protein